MTFTPDDDSPLVDGRTSRLDRMYRALAAVNEAVVRATSREDLKHDVCRILVETGGFKMAWIGAPEPDGFLAVQARCGDVTGYLDGIRVSTADVDEGRGPAGSAFRERRPVVVNDFAHDPRTKVWRERASASGLLAAMGIPLRFRGDVVAILAVYAGERDFFGDHEMQLAEKAGAVLSFGLEALARNHERDAALVALEESERRMRFLVSATPAIIYTCQISDFTTTFMSDNVTGILGYTPADFVYSPHFWREHVHPEDLPRALAEGATVVERGAIVREYRFLDARGRYLWMQDDLRVVRDARGAPAILAGCWLDITAKKVAEESLRVRESIFSAIVEHAEDAMVLFELDSGRFVEFNDAAHQGLGYSRDEFARMTILDILADGLPAEVRHRLMIGGSGERFDGEVRYRTRDGQTRNASVRASALLLRGRSYVAATWNDVTDRVRAAEALKKSEELYRLIAESTNDIIWILDLGSKTLRYVSPSAGRLLGIDPADIVGRGLDAILTPAALAAALEDISQRTARVEAGDASQLSRLLLLDHRKAGVEILNGEVVLSLLRDVSGRVTQALGVSRDITDRVRASAELQRSRDRLEEERNSLALRVAERTADLSRVNVELARAARAKDEFLANMSHELRTPLNAILALSETLLDEIRGPLNARQRSSVQTIHASGNHLLALITDILDLSKVEAGRMDLQIEPVRVIEACESSLAFVKEFAAKKSIRVTMESSVPDAVVEADARRLKQMIVNLLSNAVKFTPEGGSVTLEVGEGATAEVLRITVRDTGIGIAQHDLDRLFRPFVQVDSSLSRQHEGTGLGLALVRKLVEMHRGTISVESTPGQGSSFTITLPRSGDRVAGTSLPALPVARRARGALIVDDTESTAELLARYLSELDVPSTTVKSGDAAIATAAELQPEVIFLDILLPGRNGWDVLADLKGDPATKHIPVVIVTVLDERVRGLAAGAVEYLVQPVSRDEVRNALDTAARAFVTASQRVSGPAREMGANPARKILLADDGEFNIIAIGDYLLDMGYDVSVARNGQEAIDLATEVQPDLILMDVQMPHVDGLEATRQLRARPGFAHLPIIALTGLAMAGDRERCLAAGATDYLAKPVSPRLLLDTIKRYLNP